MDPDPNSRPLLLLDNIYAQQRGDLEDREHDEWMRLRGALETKINTAKSSSAEALDKLLANFQSKQDERQQSLHRASEMYTKLHEQQMSSTLRSRAVSSQRRRSRPRSASPRMSTRQILLSAKAEKEETLKRSVSAGRIRTPKVHVDATSMLHRLDVLRRAMTHELQEQRTRIDSFRQKEYQRARSRLVKEKHMTTRRDAGGAMRNKIDAVRLDCDRRLQEKRLAELRANEVLRDKLEQVTMRRALAAKVKRVKAENERKINLASQRTIANLREAHVRDRQQLCYELEIERMNHNKYTTHVMAKETHKWRDTQYTRRQDAHQYTQHVKATLSAEARAEHALLAERRKEMNKKNLEVECVIDIPDTPVTTRHVPSIDNVAYSRLCGDDPGRTMKGKVKPRVAKLSPHEVEELRKLTPQQYKQLRKKSDGPWSSLPEHVLLGGAASRQRHYDSWK